MRKILSVILAVSTMVAGAATPMQTASAAEQRPVQSAPAPAPGPGAEWMFVREGGRGVIIRRGGGFRDGGAMRMRGYSGRSWGGPSRFYAGRGYDRRRYGYYGGRNYYRPRYGYNRGYYGRRYYGYGGRYYGRHYYGGYYPRYRYGYYDDGFYGAGIAGLAVGAIVGSALSQPRYYGAPSGSYCAQRYRSYDPRSGTYLGNDGRRHPCP